MQARAAWLGLWINLPGAVASLALAPTAPWPDAVLALTYLVWVSSLAVFEEGKGTPVVLWPSLMAKSKQISTLPASWKSSTKSASRRLSWQVAHEVGRSQPTRALDFPSEGSASSS
jgi:hypothetical protein